MAHHFDTGFTVRQPAWHGLGVLLEEAPKSIEAARIAAGLTWEPVVRPTYIQRPYAPGIGFDERIDFMTEHADYVSLGSAGYMEPLADHKLIVRNDTEAVIGVVGKGFEIVSNQETFEIIEAILGEGAEWDTAGSIKGGSQVWALARLNEPEFIAGDDSPTFPYIVVRNAHDGSGACTVQFTNVRVVCWNTYSAAEAEAKRHQRAYTFRHTAKVGERIEEAKQALSGARTEIAEWKTIAEGLYAMPINEDQVKTFVQLFLPSPEENGEVISDRVRNNVAVARKAFNDLYMESPTCDGHRGTALGVIDAAVEWLDHVRGFRTQESYLGRTILRPEAAKGKAVKLVREVCGV